MSAERNLTSILQLLMRTNRVHILKDEVCEVGGVLQNPMAVAAGHRRPAIPSSSIADRRFEMQSKTPRATR